MDTDKKYLLDANVFIEANKRYYAFDLSPGFWECLIKNHEKDRVFSIDRIKKDLEDYDDVLSQWIRTKMPSTCFVSTNNPSVISWYGKMQAWANGQPQYKDEAKAEFADTDNHDCWLTAYAKANSYILVTHEVYDPNRKNKIPIPNVCQAFGIKYINTFDMLRALEIKLVLEG